MNSTFTFKIMPQGFSIAILIGLGVLMMAVAIFLYVRCRRTLGRPAEILMGLRCFQILLLFIILFSPALVKEGRKRIPGRALLLLDHSASMDFRPEGEAGASRWERLRKTLSDDGHALIRAIEDRRDVALFTMDRTLERVSGDPDNGYPDLDAPPRGDASFLGSGIIEAIGKYRGTLTEIVVFSDGAHNGGVPPETAAQYARDAQVRLYTVMVDDGEIRDTAVISASANSILRRGDALRIAADIAAHGYDVPVETQARLRQGDRVLGERLVTLRPGRRQRIGFEINPSETGTIGLTVELEPQPGERFSLNNHAHLTTRIVDRTLKVLFMDEVPRWEYRYLKNFMSRDRGLDATVILRSALAPDAPSPFPHEPGKLAAFDVILLGDLSPEVFRDGDLDALEDFVSRHGGGLALLAGENALPAAYRDTPMETLLPVLLPPPDRPADHHAPPDRPFALRLTPAGEADARLMLAADPAGSRQAWDAFPGHYWCAMAAGLRPGAAALAVHPDLRAGHDPLPLIAAQRYGKGRVLYLGVDSTWRWRLDHADTDFDRFWGQVIRGLAPARDDGSAETAITTGGDHHRENDPVPIALTAVHRNGQPAHVPLRSLIVDGAAGQTALDRIPLERVPGQPGAYQGAWTPSQAGEYLLRTEDPDIVPGAAVIRIGASRLEWTRPAPDPELLHRMAGIAGGECLPLADAASLPGKWPRNEREVWIRTYTSLWNVWPVFLLLVAANLIELVLRKRWGLS